MNETWREDATNLDRAIPRNRVRHDVMPELRAINAQADAALARAAEILRGDEEFLERLANAAFLRCVQADDRAGDGDRWMWRSLRSCRWRWRRRVARYALETANPSRSYGLEEVDELRRALAGESQAEIFPACAWNVWPPRLS